MTAGGLGGSEEDEVGEAQEIVVRPDVEFVMLPRADIWEHVLLDIADVGRAEPVAKLRHELLLADIFAVELFYASLQMPEIEFHAVTHEPLKIVPIAPFDAMLPGAVDERVHLAGIEVGECEAASHERMRLQE